MLPIKMLNEHNIFLAALTIFTGATLIPDSAASCMAINSALTSLCKSLVEENLAIYFVPSSSIKA
jgi:hypothetical protein